MCGGNLTSSTGLLTSPNYPGKYASNVDCLYTISQPNGTIIELLPKNIDTEHSIYTEGDWLEIRDGSSSESPLMAKLRGKYTFFETMQSTQNNVWLR